LTGAVRRYLQIHGESVTQRFCHVMVPVNIRSQGEAHGMGNRVSLLPLALPLDISGPVDRLHAIVRRTQTAKKTPLAGTFGLLGALMEATPAPLQALLSRVPFVSLPF